MNTREILETVVQLLKEGNNSEAASKVKQAYECDVDQSFTDLSNAMYQRILLEDAQLAAKFKNIAAKHIENEKDKGPIIINNNNNSTHHMMGNKKNKWIALTLCIFFGFFGAHYFYEGKAGKGFLYLFTMGLFGFGWIIDIFGYLGKPNPYYVHY